MHWNHQQASSNNNSSNHYYVVLVAQSCLTLCDRMGYSLPGSFVHGILQARILEWSRGSFWPRNQTRSPALQADSLPSEPPGKPLLRSEGFLSAKNGAKHFVWIKSFNLYKDLEMHVWELTLFYRWGNQGTMGSLAQGYTVSSYELINMAPESALLTTKPGHLSTGAKNNTYQNDYPNWPFSYVFLNVC